MGDNDSAAEERHAILIHNEQVKLRAGFYNSVSGTVMIAGSVTPLGLLLFGNVAPHRHLWLWGAGMTMFVVVGLLLQRLAARTLEGLKI